MTKYDIIKVTNRRLSFSLCKTVVYYKNQGLGLPNRKWEGPSVSTMGYFCQYHRLYKIYKWRASPPLPSYLKHGNVYYANFWKFRFSNFDCLSLFETYRWKLFALYLVIVFISLCDKLFTIVRVCSMGGWGDAKKR